MSYTPTEWAAGDVVTAEKLNKIEDELVALDSGSGDEEQKPLEFRTITYENNAPNEFMVTPNEIINAPNTLFVGVLKPSGSTIYGYINSISPAGGGGTYALTVDIGGQSATFIATSADSNYIYQATP